MIQQNNVVYIKLIYDRKKKGNPSTDGAVEIRVTFQRRQKYLATGVSCRPRHWKSGMVVGRLDAHELNVQLDRMIRDVRWIINEMQHDGHVDLDDIPRWMDDMSGGIVSMWDYFRKRKEARSYGKGPSVSYRLSFFLDWLFELGYIRRFRDINAENIVRMDMDLISAGLKSSTRWYNYHRLFKALISDAVRDGHLKRNPYNEVRVCADRDSDESLDHVLTSEELNSLRNCFLPTVSLCQVRDLFLFQTYTCMAYIDMSEFDYSLLKEIDGRYVYSGTRRKTGKKFCFVLLEPAVEIVKKYFGTLPIISNQKYNSYLKIVMQFAGINRPVTTHWARHTGATLLLNAGVPMDVVAKVLGHSSIEITRKIYAKMLEETVIREMERVRL